MCVRLLCVHWNSLNMTWPSIGGDRPWSDVKIALCIHRCTAYTHTHGSDGYCTTSPPLLVWIQKVHTNMSIKNHSRVTHNERIRCRVDLKTPVCLSVCPHCLLAFVPECDAPACCVQDRPLRFIILTGNPTAKCSRASSWKQGVKSCDWWVLCFPLLANQRVSSQGENAPHNHYLNIFFTKNLLV